MGSQQPTSPSAAAQLVGLPLEELLLLEEEEVLLLLLEEEPALVEDVLLALVDDEVLLAADELVLEAALVDEVLLDDTAVDPPPDDDVEEPPDVHRPAQRSTRQASSMLNVCSTMQSSDVAGSPRQATQAASPAHACAGPQQLASMHELQAGLVSIKPQLRGPPSGSAPIAPPTPPGVPTLLEPPTLCSTGELVAHAAAMAAGARTRIASKPRTGRS